MPHEPALPANSTFQIYGTSGMVYVPEIIADKQCKPKSPVRENLQMPPSCKILLLFPHKDVAIA
jgi:hypothetical protein